MNPARLLAGLFKGLFFQSPGMLGFAKRFLEAWNRQDAQAVLRLIGQGTYRDPLCQGAVREDVLRDHVEALFTAFPDLRFELTGPVSIGDRTLTAGYCMRGRHDGPLPGGLGIEAVDPTHRELVLKGSMSLNFESAGAVHVENHFALDSLADQLGFLALLMPRTQGDYQFGAYYRLNRGNTAPPEAIGMTWLLVRGGQEPFDEAARVTNHVLESFADKPGFITGIIGARPPDEHGNSSGFTLSAWENIEALEANLLPNEDHKKVVHRFMKEGFAYGTHSRVYKLVRAKTVMIACVACGKKNNPHKRNPVCSACGEPLEAPPPYW